MTPFYIAGRPASSDDAVEIRHPYDGRLVGTTSNATEAQVESIVRMQLGQLAGLERDEIFKEYNDLRAKIIGYERLLGEDANVKAVIRADLVEMSNKYGDERAFVNACLARKLETVDRELIDSEYEDFRKSRDYRRLLKLKQITPA